jgi:hypothetical protein
MDPMTCLKDCHSMALHRDLIAANASLLDYWEWRDNGGFEPVCYGIAGDLFAAECFRVIGVMSQMPTRKGHTA